MYFFPALREINPVLFISQIPMKEPLKYKCIVANTYSFTNAISTNLQIIRNKVANKFKQMLRLQS